MTTTEYETHFTLWAMLKSPLLLGACRRDRLFAHPPRRHRTGNDLGAMSADTLRIVSNKHLIVCLWAAYTR
jgi:alpha-galactosidase